MDWKWLLTSYQGRINRAKFWAGIGVLIAISVVINIIMSAVLGTSMTGDNMAMMGGGALIVLIIVSLVMLYLSLAVYAKRWHDRDKSGWWSLILIVPVIGFVWWLVECGMLEGTRGPNHYGPDPLA